MKRHDYTFKRKSDLYIGVYIYVHIKTHQLIYKTSCKNSKVYMTERDAAIAYDKIQINKNKKPANILKAKI